MPRAWGDERIVPVQPVSASIAVADVTLPKLCYLCRPDVGVRGHGEPVPRRARRSPDLAAASMRQRFPGGERLWRTLGRVG
jgi:hypothetical protein